MIVAPPKDVMADTWPTEMALEPPAFAFVCFPGFFRVTQGRTSLGVSQIC